LQSVFWELGSVITVETKWEYKESEWQPASGGNRGTQSKR